jgi:hypothetical protein
MRVWPFGRRSQVTRTRNELIISIPAPCNIVLLLFLSVWLIAWAVGEVFIPRQVVIGEIPLNAFIFSWFVGWTIGGAFAIRSWLWMVRGREIVRVTRRVLGIRRRVWSFGSETQFDAAEIFDLRVADDAFQLFGEEDPPQYGWNQGPLAFEYGGRTVRFGKGLRKAEAQEVVEEIDAMIAS